MEYTEFSAKTVNDAITEACQKFSVTSEHLDYEIKDEGSSGFLGIGSRPAVIKARIKEEAEVTIENVEKLEKEANTAVKEKKEAKEAPTAKKIDSASVEESAKVFLKDVFAAMKIEVSIETKYDEAEKNLDIDLSGEDMGMLIGKRGATLDSLQYLVSLVVNKDVEDYIRVKVDTENYRQRRKETLENLAKNIAYKVKRNKKAVSLEPMNPYERRIIHSALQNDKYVSTHSEGEEPFRRVVVTLKK